MVDKIRPLKIENTACGGSSDDNFPTEADCQEDYIAVRGVSFTGSDNHLIDTADNELQFIDPVSGTVKLSQLAGATSIPDKIERLGVKEIDGSTNSIDTNYALYVVPTSYYAEEITVSITNRNSTIATVRLAHVDGNIADISNGDYILYDSSLLPHETKYIKIPVMAVNHSILIRSDVVDLNFKAYGYPRLGTSSKKRLAAFSVSSANQNQDALLTTSKVTNLQYYICNRSSTLSATINTALIDSNGLLNLADEDYDLYQEIILQGETKGFDVGYGMNTNELFMINSSSTDVNILIYGIEYT